MRKEFFDEIFKANKTIIIPGLGAFTRNNPNDKATFNSFLKFNDGLLAGYFSKKLGISVADAGKLLEANVKQIITTMTTTGKVSIGGMGHFNKGKDGKFAFVYDQTAEATVPFDTTGKGDTGIKENRVVHEIKKDAPKPEVKDVKKEPEKKPVIPEVKKEEVKKEEKKPVAEVKKEEPKKEEVKKEDPKNKFIKPKPEKKPKDPNAKKKKLPWVWIGVLVILGGAGTFAAIKWEMVKGWFASNHAVEVKHDEKEEPKEEPKADSTASVVPQDSTGENGNNVKEEPVKEEPVKEKPIKEKPIKEKPVVNTPPVATYGDFHVIVNCYQSEANANNMVSKLSAKGYSAQNLGNRGGFFMVSAGSASSKEEANGILDKARAEFPKAWIYNGK